MIIVRKSLRTVRTALNPTKIIQPYSTNYNVNIQEKSATKNSRKLNSKNIKNFVSP